MNCVCVASSIASGVVRQQPGTARVGPPQCVQQQQLRVDAGGPARGPAAESLGKVGGIHNCSDFDSLVALDG